MLDKAIFAIVELFGHQTIAGKVSEETIGGSAFIRVDVPECDGAAAFTKFYGAGAIYAITPTDESTMQRAVKGLKVVPINPFQLGPTIASKLLDEPVIARKYVDDDDDFEDDLDGEEYEPGLGEWDVTGAGDQD